MPVVDITKRSYRQRLIANSAIGNLGSGKSHAQLVFLRYHYGLSCAILVCFRPVEQTKPAFGVRVTSNGQGLSAIKLYCVVVVGRTAPAGTRVLAGACQCKRTC